VHLCGQAAVCTDRHANSGCLPGARRAQALSWSGTRPHQIPARAGNSAYVDACFRTPEPGIRHTPKTHPPKRKRPHQASNPAGALRILKETSLPWEIRNSARRWLSSIRWRAGLSRMAAICAAPASMASKGRALRHPRRAISPFTLHHTPAEPSSGLRPFCGHTAFSTNRVFSRLRVNRSVSRRPGILSACSSDFSNVPTRNRVQTAAVKRACSFLRSDDAECLAQREPGDWHWMSHGLRKHSAPGLCGWKSGSRFRRSGPLPRDSACAESAMVANWSIRLKRGRNIVSCPSKPVFFLIWPVV